MNSVSIVSEPDGLWSLTIQPERAYFTSVLGLLYSVVLLALSGYGVLIGQLHPIFLVAFLVLIPKSFRAVWTMYGSEHVVSTNDGMEFTRRIGRFLLGKPRQLGTADLKVVKAITRLRDGGKLPRREYSLEFVGSLSKVQLYSGFTQSESLNLLKSLPLPEEIKEVSFQEKLPGVQRRVV